ncbi:MAG: TIM barrel protein [Flavobacteriaceae bacterium]
MQPIQFNILKCIILLLYFQAAPAQESGAIDISQTYPWCIVAYDSLERTPAERIDMIKELGFVKYAYDWRDNHLDNTSTELKLAAENNIEIISIWLWLNVKRDSLDHLSASNEQIFDIVEQMNLKTTFWVSLSENFFRDLTDEESVKLATEMIAFVTDKAKKINCRIALYNHSGWFGDPYNQLKVIQALPHSELSLVYNFHHGQKTIDDFPNIVQAIRPYLTAVNLNGMEKGGEKILTIGKGSHEKEMIELLRKNGFEGPWGILGHVEGADVKQVLKQNLAGLKSLKCM